MRSVTQILIFCLHKDNIPLNIAFFPSGAGFFVSGNGSFDALLVSLSHKGYEE